MLRKVERINGELAFVYRSHPTNCLFEGPLHMNRHHHDPAFRSPSAPKLSWLVATDRNRVDVSLLTRFIFFQSCLKTDF